MTTIDVSTPAGRAGRAEGKTMDKSKTRIIEILREGNIIRMIDGRYTDGFVDVEDLQDLITDGLAESFVDNGFGFARLAKRKTRRKRVSQ